MANGIRVGGLFLFLVLAVSACSFDASIEDLKQVELPESATHITSISVTPSMQRQAFDQSGQYLAESAVGEITTSETASSDDGSYRAEISIRYQTR